MNWLKTIDSTLFHWINSSWSNPLLDALTPIITGGRFLPIILLVSSVLLICKGKARGRILCLFLFIVIPLGQHFAIGPIKEAVSRTRPFVQETSVRLISGVSLPHDGCMPSGQAAIWFAATTIVFVFYRRSVYLLLPYSIVVGLLRIYAGVHYPSDVLCGAILGTGYAGAGLWILSTLWQKVGSLWFPLWWKQLPNLLQPVLRPPDKNAAVNVTDLDAHRIRLGYVIIFFLMLANLAYNASGMITLTEDEAYQWTWSKHLALSYYSKPLLIAFTQYAGTHLWGDTVFGVRFFPPIIGALTSLAILRFMSRVANSRVALAMCIIMPLSPLLALGSVIMTIDPLNVMFWIFAMIAGWKAVQENSKTRDWCWVGIWMGLSLLSKYTALFQLLSWILFFAISQNARKQLRRSGPWLALLINLLFSTPIVIWNWQRHWITLQHVKEGGRLEEGWGFTPAALLANFLKYTLEFLGTETLLLNPFFIIPAIAALFLFRRSQRQKSELMLYLFSMGAPVFVFYFILTIHTRVLPNWIAPSVVPFFCLGAIYWEQRYSEGLTVVKRVFKAGVALGIAAVVLLHDLSLVEMFTGYHIPDALDSTRRVKGYAETAQVVENARQKLIAKDGKPAFIIGGHYGITGELSFHIPEAKSRVATDPLVFFLTSTKPQNQFYFWPGYTDKKGQNAIFAREIDFSGTNSPGPDAVLKEQFESITDVGPVMVESRGRPMRRLQILECRGLK